MKIECLKEHWIETAIPPLSTRGLNYPRSSSLSSCASTDLQFVGKCVRCVVYVGRYYPCEQTKLLSRAGYTSIPVLAVNQLHAVF